MVGRASASGLQEKIDRRLEEVNDSLSTYRPESEINRFSRFPRTGEEFPVGRDFLEVMKTAARVYELSGGAWDGTVRPLVDLWGFGPLPPVSEPPDPRRIEALLGEIGFDEIEIRKAALVKRQAAVTLDLSSIAKGYGVDQVAEVIRGAGFSDFLVEIGGEVYGKGSRRDGGAWRVGINRPRADSAPDEIYRVAALRDAAFATSGDYRNFFVRDGVRYSHVLDPRTGRPVANGVVSVSVLAPDCTLADGLATAVMVMGAEAGIALAGAPARRGRPRRRGDEGRAARGSRHDRVPVRASASLTAVRPVPRGDSYTSQRLARPGPSPSAARAMFTSSTIWKSYIPTQMKSAPFRKAYLNPSLGGMAPAARTL